VAKQVTSGVTGHGPAVRSSDGLPGTE